MPRPWEKTRPGVQTATRPNVASRGPAKWTNLSRRVQRLEQPGKFQRFRLCCGRSAGPGGHALWLIYVSDEVGGAVPAFSDGTNWRRVTDRAIVS
jgi:hypothetical protein